MGHNYIKTIVVMVVFPSTQHYHLMMLNIFTKFQENISVDFKVISEHGLYTEIYKVA